MKVVITGVTGFIGTQLARALGERGDTVVGLTRNPASPSARRVAAIPNARVAGWSGRPGSREEWWSAVDGADAVVHLAGESVVGHRWSDDYKRRILESRTRGTAAVVEAIGAAEKKPATLVSASAIGYYGFRGAEPLDESAPAGSDFLATVCRDWEAAAKPVEALGVRLVTPRIGVVIGEEGGALSQMLPAFKLGVGGPIGSGRQWMSWVSLDDTIGLLLFVLDHAELRGPVNVVAPKALTNREFSKVLGRVVHRPSWLPVPKFALRIGLGAVAEMLVEGQHVVPAAARKAGYAFRFPELEPALQNALSK